MIADSHRIATCHPSKRVYRNGTAALHRTPSSVTPELMATLGFIDEQQYNQMRRKPVPPAPQATIATVRTRTLARGSRTTPKRNLRAAVIPVSILAIMTSSLLFSAPRVHANEDLSVRFQEQHPRPHPLVMAPMPIDATAVRIGVQPLPTFAPARFNLLSRPLPAATPAQDVERIQRQQRLLATIPSTDPTGGGEVTSTFGYRSDPFPEFHRGVDLAQPTGHPITASADGTVAFAGWAGGFGNKIEIKHGSGYETWYGHLSHVDVVAGQHVNRGAVIGEVGSTGEATGPHLHYQIMLDGVAIDPMPYLKGVPGSALALAKTR